MGVPIDTVEAGVGLHNAWILTVKVYVIVKDAGLNAIKAIK